jgi:hypothetical protein
MRLLSEVGRQRLKNDGDTGHDDLFVFARYPLRMVVLERPTAEWSSDTTSDGFVI